MKKLTSLIISVVLFAVALLPINVQAVNAESKAGIVNISSGRLNVRSSNSTNATIVAYLSKGSYITLISKNSSWWYVEYAQGKYGYCYGDYINTVSSSFATVNIQSGRLNVRSGAGTSYSVKSSLYKGETVLILSNSSGWSRVLYRGTQTGYVSTQYLSGTPVYSAVSLKVPSFKQTDSRWANVKIGNSGYTIEQIGCATTAIAMMESYRTGQTIYPDAMSKKLSYSSSGSVYWPSNYTPVTNGTGYLSGIYEKLKGGKPIMFGAKKASGDQHWVVITGYTGGRTLTASGFTINDPGSNTRTTLQALLNTYPTFYKYFYYN